MSDVPIDDLLLPDTTPALETDPTQAYEGGGEEAVDGADGLGDDLLGDKPLTPEA